MNKQHQITLWDKFGKGEFSQEEARQALGFRSRSGTWQVLSKLRRAGVVEKTADGYRLLHAISGSLDRFMKRKEDAHLGINRQLEPEATAEETSETFVRERRAKKKARRFKKHADTLADRVEELEEQLAFHTELGREVALLPPESRAIEPRARGGTSRDVPVMCFSDLHAGETVEGKHVNHLNEWNEDICNASVDALFRNFVSRIKARERGGSVVHDAVLWLGGDLMTGYLHEDQQESNWMSPIEETLYVFDVVRTGIDYLLNSTDLARIDVICNYGNHGRTTKKPRSAGAETSFEWGIYRQLARYYEGEERLNFIISPGYMVYHQILDARVCFHHGDSVRYAGGVGGLSIPLNKAIANWAKSGPRAYHVLGHYHQWLPGSEFFVNGSVVGYSPYALKIKAAFEKPQQGLLWFTEGHKTPVALERIWCRP